MIAGEGALPLVGIVTVAENVLVLPPWVTFTVIFELVTVPVTMSGLDGFLPSAIFSAVCRISSRRQRHSDFMVISVPSSFLFGSGCWATLGPLPGIVPTVQSAPVSSM